MIEIITILFISVSAYIAGIVSVFLLMFIRMRSDSDLIDPSNLMNAIRLICVIALHPSWLLQMKYIDGRTPFKWLGEDEFESVVAMRPPK